GSWVPILFQPEYIEARTIAGDTQADAFFVRTATLLVVVGAALAALLVIGAPGLLSLVAGEAAPSGDGLPPLPWPAPILPLPSRPAVAGPGCACRGPPACGPPGTCGRMAGSPGRRCARFAGTSSRSASSWGSRAASARWPCRSACSPVSGCSVWC